MSSPTGYTVQQYGDMINCKPRMDAYRDALQNAITPGCRVLDIGAGTGITSLIAAQLGAGKVIALEPNDAIELLMPAARANGLADRIEVQRGLSSALELDEPVDVIVSDLRGSVPLFETHIPTIIDARTRLLRPGGTLIPGMDRVFAAPVENPKGYACCDMPWTAKPYGLDIDTGRAFVVNAFWGMHVPESALLAPAKIWAEIDYAVVQSADHAAALEFQATRAGTFHGWMSWFDTELVAGIGYSGAPGQPELVYGQGFMPLQRTIELLPGDRLTLDLRARLVGGEYLWDWRTRYMPSDPASESIDFHQSNFKSRVGLLRHLNMRRADATPQLGARAAIDSDSISLMDGHRTLGEAARELARRYPGHFRDVSHALDHLGTLLERYTS